MLPMDAAAKLPDMFTKSLSQAPAIISVAPSTRVYLSPFLGRRCMPMKLAGMKQARNMSVWASTTLTLHENTAAMTLLIGLNPTPKRLVETTAKEKAACIFHL